MKQKILIPTITFDELKKKRRLDAPMATGGVFASGGPELIDGIPTELTATATETSIDLEWNNGSTNEDGIIIERGLDTENFAAINVVSNGENTYSDEAVVEEVEYNYRVKAFKGHSYSLASNITQATLLNQWSSAKVDAYLIALAASANTTPETIDLTMHHERTTASNAAMITLAGKNKTILEEMKILERSKL